MEAVNETVGPSFTKRARVDLNDSFYDSEEDELVSQACGLYIIFILLNIYLIVIFFLKK